MGQNRGKFGLGVNLQNMKEGERGWLNIVYPFNLVHVLGYTYAELYTT